MSSGGVGVEQVGDGFGDLLGGGDVEELVGAGGVAPGGEDAGDDELGLGQRPAQHPHERDRAALADVAGIGAEGGPGGGGHGGVEPGGEGRGGPAALGGGGGGRDHRAVGRIGPQDLFDRPGGGGGVARRRQAE